MTDYSGGWPRRPLLVRVWMPPTDKMPIQRQIDQPVYELYGLTDDEIRTVEGTTEK